jgi:hypothetical protein
MNLKTYKRELAVVLLIWLMYVVETKDASTIEILVWPVFTFAALAFGMDWFGKSGSNGLRDDTFISSDRGRAKRGSSSSDGQGEQSGSRKPDNPD